MNIFPISRLLLISSNYEKKIILINFLCMWQSRIFKIIPDKENFHLNNFAALLNVTLKGNAQEINFSWRHAAPEKKVKCIALKFLSHVIHESKFYHENAFQPSSAREREKNERAFEDVVGASSLFGIKNVADGGNRAFHFNKLYYIRTSDCRMFLSSQVILPLSIAKKKRAKVNKILPMIRKCVKVKI